MHTIVIIFAALVCVLVGLLYRQHKKYKLLDSQYKYFLQELREKELATKDKVADRIAELEKERLSLMNDLLAVSAAYDSVTDCLEETKNWLTHREDFAVGEKVPVLVDGVEYKVRLEAVAFERGRAVRMFKWKSERFVPEALFIKLLRKHAAAQKKQQAAKDQQVISKIAKDDVAELMHTLFEPSLDDANLSLDLAKVRQGKVDKTK